MIEDGAETVMAAHIMLPAYSQKGANPDIRDENSSGSLSCDLTTKLLRKTWDLTGLVVTDATTMTGFMPQTMARRDAPLAVAAGYDRILFTLDLKKITSTCWTRQQTGPSAGNVWRSGCGFWH